MKISKEEKDRLESELNALEDWGRYIHPFSGDGIDLMLLAIIKKRGNEFLLQGVGNASYNTSVQANDFSIGVFGRFGKREDDTLDAVQGSDLNEVITLAACQVLGLWRKPRLTITKGELDPFTADPYGFRGRKVVDITNERSY